MRRNVRRAGRMGVLRAAAFCLGLGTAASLAQDQVEYGYDGLGRLIVACYDGASAVTYQYDPAGNRSVVDTVATACGPATFSIGNATAVSEGGVLNFTVTRSGNTGAGNSIAYTTEDDEANEGSDYTAKRDVLVFAPGETSKSITVQTLNDSLYENAETVLVTLSNPTGIASITQMQASGAINNTSAAPTFAINNRTVSEGNNLTFTITKSGETALTHGLSYATANSTAVAGEDYTAKSGTLSFGPSQTSKTVTISSTEDAVYENQERFFVLLSNATNGATFSDSQANGYINNDDPAPSFTISDSSVVAGNNLSFTVTKSGSTALSHNVNYATANGTATAGTHYTAKSGTLSFTAGQTSKTVTVSTVVNSVPSGGKLMYVNLTNPTNNATIADSQGVGVINETPNSPPDAVNDTVFGAFNVFTNVNVYVLNNDSDPNGDPLTVTSATCLSSGCSVSVVNGTYLSVLGTFEGVKQIRYYITDGRNETDNAIVTVDRFGGQCGEFEC